MEYGTVLGHRAPSAAPKASMVMEEAVERRWIMEFCQGQYVYGTRWAAIVRALQCKLVERAQALGFEEWILPRYIPRGALDSFKLTQFAPDLLLSAGEESFLDPVQCVSLYHHLRGKTLRAEDLPIRVVEVMGGWTWRNEQPQDLDGPYRAREFLRVEHVFCGEQEQVRRLRATMRDNLTGFLDRLGVGWQVVVGHGCMDLPSLTNMRLGAKSPEDVPVQDIEVPIRGALHRLPDDLPAPGTTTHNVYRDGGMTEVTSDAAYWDHDEISGCSVEGDHLTKDFCILDTDGKPLWSGCCGIGLNRLVLALLYQHGFETVEAVVREACAGPVEE